MGNLFDVFGTLGPSDPADVDFAPSCLFLKSGEAVGDWKAPSDGWWRIPACDPRCCPPSGPFATEEEARQ